MRFLLVPIIVMFLTQAACVPSRDASTPLPPTQPPVTPTMDSGDNPTQALPDGAVIVYQRSGGIAGLNETYTIYADGRVTSADGQEWQVSPQEVQSLLKEIEQTGILEVEQTGPSKVPCCDRISYTLTVSLDGKTHTIQTYDGATGQLESIQSAIDAVNKFLNNKRLPES